MDTRELYQQVILDHNRSPKNFKKIEKPTSMAVGHNPLCGDEITVSIVVEDGVVEDVGFQGVGCAISQASASMMTAAIKGKPVDAVKELFEKFHRMVASDEDTDLDAMGKLAAFGGVREFPARVKCASLPWHTMKAALDDVSETVVTE